jgi:hypothetical protein
MLELLQEIDMRPLISVDLFYIFGEDLASALVGPFLTREEAEQHLKFCADRGDGARSEVISGFVARKIDERNIGIYLTPEEDKKPI